MCPSVFKTGLICVLVNFDTSFHSHFKRNFYITMVESGLHVSVVCVGFSMEYYRFLFVFVVFPPTIDCFTHFHHYQ